MERDSIYFALFLSVCDCTSLALIELSYKLLFFPFFLSRKKRTIKLNLYLVLLEKSSDILSATVQDSTLIQTV